jgi:hypothetical protein
VANPGIGEGLSDPVPDNGGRRFNPGRNSAGYNPGHSRGLTYGGYARGWQRPPYRGYRYTGSRFHGNEGRGRGNAGRGGGDQAAGQGVPHGTGAATNHLMPMGGTSVQVNAVGPHQELQAPGVFLAQKAEKSKVEEGLSASEGKEKSFCFRCWKPGHGKLECVAKLLCDICGNTEHLTRKCPILKQPRLLAHPCGYDVSGLGFYHIPHAPITTGKTDNRTALVTVQGGELSIPQLVAELSRLIPERWHWTVTQQDKQTFVVPFPSRGDLQRSVAFGQANIKEHGVRLLFEEYKLEEEGLPLQRVWIRIYRLPQKLREFSVLWALGSMLGATQSVDMISSLRTDYGRVEVAVLNVDILPDKIDTVVIGDRLYSLPIKVEGRDDEAAVDAQMELEDGSSGAGKGAGNENAEPGNKEAGQESEKNRSTIGPTQHSNNQNYGKQMRDTLEARKKHDAVQGTDVFCDIEFQTESGGLHGTMGEDDAVQGAAGSQINACSTELMGVQDPGTGLNSMEIDLLADQSNLLDPTRVTPRKEMNMGKEAVLAEVENLASKHVKRSKRREESVDEDSSARADRLKAKKDLDSPGTSKTKSFLSFPDSRIISMITSLGIALGDEVESKIGSLKDLELTRLEEATRKEKSDLNRHNSDAEETSETESDMGFDQIAIKHLVGDIAEDVLGVSGSPGSDFKTTSRKIKPRSSKKRTRKNKKLGLSSKHSR